jgi:hypothetical protein
MKRSLALLAIAAALTPTLASGSTSRVTPVLRVVTASPLVVGGSHFRSRERVRLDVVSAGGLVKRVVAGATGVFTARFDNVFLSHCDALLIKAAGSNGSAAVLKRPAPAGCLPVRSTQAAQLPRLRIVESHPLTVTGSGFKLQERVKVVYQTGSATWTRWRTATAVGAFTARFSGVSFDACQARRLYAVGSRGSRAVLKLPQPACAQP